MSEPTGPLEPAPNTGDFPAIPTTNSNLVEVSPSYVTEEVLVAAIRQTEARILQQAADAAAERDTRLEERVTRGLRALTAWVFGAILAEFAVLVFCVSTVLHR